MKILAQILVALHRWLTGTNLPAACGECPRCGSTDIEWIPSEGWTCHNLHTIHPAGLQKKPPVHAELYRRI